MLILIKKIVDEINGKQLGRAMLVLCPFLFLSLATSHIVWIEVALLTLSSFIVEERLHLTLMGVLAHGIAVIFGIHLILFAQVIPLFFVLTCMLFGAAVAYVSAQGQKLRSLGSWTFIPALLLANEMYQKSDASTLMNESLHNMPYLLVALLPVLVASMIKKYSSRYKKRHVAHHYFSEMSDYGEKQPAAIMVMAMILGVGFAACLVAYFQMENGQWLIWGVASVVNGAVDTALIKFRSRIVGVVLGVPLGIILGQFVFAHTESNVTLAILGILLTLVGLKRYIVAYFFRCMFVALAVTLANYAVQVALERLTHVLLGGVIGVMSMAILHYLVQFKGRTKVG